MLNPTPRRFPLLPLTLAAALALGSPASVPAQELRIGGAVVDARGQALAGAELRLFPLPEPYAQDLALLEGDLPASSARTTSRDHGDFELRASGPGMWLLTAHAPGRSPVGLFLTPLLQPLEIEPLVLRASQEMAVEVVDARGRPVAGARVHFDARPGRRTTYASDSQRAWPLRQAGSTDARGRLTLQAPVSGRYQIEVVAEGFAPWSRDIAASASHRVELSPGRPQPLLVEGADGRPLASALIRALPTESPLALTDAEGRATVYPPAGESLEIQALSPTGAEVRGTLPAEGSDAPIVLRLAPPRNLAGRVLAAGSRRPVAGALIWSSQAWGSFARSGDDGSFRLEVPTGGDASNPARLQAAAWGYLSASLETAQAGGKSALAPDFTLRPAARIRGVVTDDQGRPLPGADLRQLSAETSRPVGRSAPDGSFILPPLPLHRPLALTAAHRGYAPTTLELAPSRLTEPLELTIRLSTGRLAYGTVLDVLDRPVPDALVTVKPSVRGVEEAAGPTWRVLSGEAGRFAVPDLPVGTFDLSVEADGYSPAQIPGVELTASGEVIEIGTLILSPAARLEGRVLDAWGRPLAGADIRLLPSEKDEGPTGALESPFADAQSDADGRVVLADLAADQPVDLRISLDGYAPSLLRAVRPPTDEPVEVTLESATRVSGRVLDSSGQGVAGAQVRLDPRPESLGGSPRAGADDLVRAATSQEDGTFELDGVLSGSWDLSATATGFLGGGREGLEVAAGEPTEEVIVVLERGAEVSGRVTTARGEPLADVRVSAFSPGQAPSQLSSLRSTTTDGGGRYRLTGLPRGRLSFAAEHSRHPTLTRNLEVRDEENELDFQLRDGLEISGRVVDEAGRGVAGAHVQASSPGRARGPSDGAPQAASSGSDGGFRLTVPEPGSYWLEASKQGYAASRSDDVVRVDETGLEGLELRLERGGTITGRVSGLAFDELARVQVAALRPDGAEPPAVGRLDHEGTFALRNLPWGDWLVLAEVSDGGKNARRSVSLDPTTATASVELEFGVGLTLSGQVLRGSRPASGTQVEASSLETLSGSRTRTDPSGRFRLENLDPGTYRLAVNDNLGRPEHQEQISLDGDRSVLIEIEEHTLRGRVVDDLEASPLDGVRIALTHIERGGTSLASSNARGEFEIGGLSPGRYRLQGSKDGYGAAGTEVEVGSDGGEPDVELRLRPASGLDLLVLHPGGAPANEVSLAALDPGGHLVLSGRYAASDGGRIHIQELPAGTWTLLLAGPGTPTVRQRVKVPQELVTLRLPEPGGLLLRVPDLAAAHRAGRLTLRDPQGQPYLDAHTQQGEWVLLDGTVTLPLLPAGDWTLEVRAEGQETTWSAQSRVVAGRMVEVYLE